MRYRATAAARKENNPWTGVVNKLMEQANAAPAPRKLAVWQLYMSKKSERIAELFDERWPTANLPEKDRLKFRGEIARELLEGESDEYRKVLEEEVNSLHEQDMQEHHAATMPPASEEEDEKARCVHLHDRVCALI